MQLDFPSALTYFNRWFSTPVEAFEGASVECVLDALNCHPIANDETAQDYVMPAQRYREVDGRFRIFGENQDVFYCFLRSGDEHEVDPPVFFESKLDLERDLRIEPSSIIDGDHVLMADRFSDFLWHILGQYICIRRERPTTVKSPVCGLVFQSHGTVKPGQGFKNPLGSEPPQGYSTYLCNDTICCPGWGAAFLNPQAKERFLSQHPLSTWQGWA